MAPGQRRFPRSGAPRPIRLLSHGGILAAVNPADWIHHWRHPNHLMLAVSWPVFFGLVASGYLVLNLIFASLYWLDRQGIGGVAGGRTSFGEAFFFSVQTLGSIGYGALYPVTLPTNLLVTLESLVGLVFIALVTGLAFSRFSRSTARIQFSDVATVHAYNGQPTLTFRMANVRRNTILDAHIQAYLAIDEYTLEGRRMRRLHPMTMSRDRSPLFLLTWTAMHPIDSNSPLHGLTVDELAAQHAELLISFRGIDEILDRSIYAHHNYAFSQVLYDHDFVDMMQEDDDQGRCFDFVNFNRTQGCI